MEQEKLEIKGHCFISQPVCVSTVACSGRGQPSLQRGLSFSVSPGLHLLLKHKHVSLQREPPVNHKAPESRGLPAAPGSQIGFPAAERTNRRKKKLTTAPTCGLTLIRLAPRRVYLICSEIPCRIYSPIL